MMTIICRAMGMCGCVRRCVAFYKTENIHQKWFTFRLRWFHYANPMYDMTEANQSGKTDRKCTIELLIVTIYMSRVFFLIFAVSPRFTSLNNFQLRRRQSWFIIRFFFLFSSFMKTTESERSDKLSLSPPAADSIFTDVVFLWLSVSVAVKSISFDSVEKCIIRLSLVHK